MGKLSRTLGIHELTEIKTEKLFNRIPRRHQPPPPENTVVL